MSVTWNALGSDKSLLDITELITKKPWFDSITVTTNANGQAALGILQKDAAVVCAWTTTNTTTRITPYVGSNSGEWWISCRKVSDDSKVANTSLDVQIVAVTKV